MNLKFNNRTALITGASRGIGKSIAKHLALEGIKVICVSRNKNNCENIVNSIKENGGSAEALIIDVSNSKAVKEGSDFILKKYKKIDILINNAGINRDQLIMRMTNEDWDCVIATNLSSCFYWSKALMHSMIRNRWGRIINISSIVGITGNAGQANYAASKAGILGLTKSLARELASRSITVNAIAPGFIETNMTSNLSDKVKMNILKTIPLKRFGQTDEIATMTTYLCSQEASYITGQVFSIDGGMVM